MAEGGSAILPGLEFEVAPLLEHLTCPVCMDVMRNATTTVPCAHTFCGKCVRQALNLKHECPMCKAPVQVENLIPNRQCDALVDTLDRQKAAATARYFERLATPPGGAWTGSRTDRGISDERCGKIETVFRQHHQQAMMVFQSAAEEVRRAFALRAKYLKEIEQTDASDDEEQSRTELERLQVAEEACMDQLAADYETHLQNAMAPLPVLGELAPTVHVDICTQKSVKTISIRLTKTMFLDDLRREVLQRLEEEGDPLVALPTKGVHVAVYPPGAHAGRQPARALPAAEDVATSLEEGLRAQTTCHQQLSFDEGTTLDASRPLLHQTSGLLTGSRIVFYGDAGGVHRGGGHGAE